MFFYLFFPLMILFWIFSVYTVQPLMQFFFLVLILFFVIFGVDIGIFGNTFEFQDIYFFLGIFCLNLWPQTNLYLDQRALLLFSRIFCSFIYNQTCFYWIFYITHFLLRFYLLSIFFVSLGKSGITGQIVYFF